MKNCLIIFYLMFINLFFACSQADKPEQVSEDVEALRKYIVFPEEPFSVKWSYKKMGKGGSIGPTDFQIIAVLSYDSLSLGQLTTLASKDERINDKVYLEKTFSKEWFPDDIKKSFYVDNNYIRVNEPIYNSAIFSKGALNSGFYFIKNNKVFLFISS